MRMGVFWRECVNAAGRVQAVHQRHRDVENDEIGNRFLDLFDCFKTVGGLIANVEVDHRSQRQTHTLSDTRLIVCHKNAQSISLPT